MYEAIDNIQSFSRLFGGIYKINFHVQKCVPSWYYLQTFFFASSIIFAFSFAAPFLLNDAEILNFGLLFLSMLTKFFNHGFASLFL